MFGSLGTKIAHATPSLGNQDLRLLQETIHKEKEVVTSAQRLSKDFGVAADAMKQWGAGEGEDLADVTNVAMFLISHIGAALNTFADHDLAIRGQLKEIRTKEEQLDELRRRRKAVGSKLETQEKKLSKMGPENKQLSLASEQLTALQNELRQLDTSILVDMARLSDSKRRIARSILVLKFGGLAEMGEKFTIIGELGKLLAAEVPQDTTPPGHGRAPYFGRETTANLIAEAGRCMGEVTFNPNADEQYSSRTPNMRPKAVGAMEPVPTGAPMLNAPPSLGDGSKFRENSRSTLGPMQHRTQTSTSSMGGTMPAMRENVGGAPVDEFGRPIDGLPMQANTMPARGGPIPQVPLSSIQQSMRSPDGEAGVGAGASQLTGYGPSTSSNIRPPPAGQGSRMGSQFVPPGPPPPGPYPPQQRPQQGQQYSQQSVSRKPPPTASGANLERGLTLSLPIRTPSTDEEEEKDSPFAPPSKAPPSNAPSAFRPPQQPVRKETSDSDVVLGEGEADLHRISTLPPKLGMDDFKVGMDDFPEWSLGLGEVETGGSPTKETPSSTEGVKKEEPEKEKTITEGDARGSVVSRGTAESSGSSQTPIIQTPTAYTETPTSYGPSIQHQLVYAPEHSATKSGQFAMFPDKRKATGAEGSTEGLVPPHAKFASHPGLNRTPSPYPAVDNASPIPTPIPTPGEEVLPINAGSVLPPEGADLSALPKSILMDPSQSRSGTTLTSMGSATATPTDVPRLRFAPRPPSPVSPSPVTPNNPAWASKESIEAVGPIGNSREASTVTVGTSGHGYEGSEGGVTGRKDNRLSVITPLGIHKHGESQPTTPRHEKEFTNTSDMTEEQFNAMLDSFQAVVGSPDTSSNPPSGIDSANQSNLSSGPGSGFVERGNTSLNSPVGPSAASRNYDDPANSSSRFGGVNVVDSSLDSTKAVAGSPFPSPRPPPAPASLSSHAHSPSDLAYRSYAGSGLGHQRQMSEDSDASGGSREPHKITASAFKKRGASPGRANAATERIVREDGYASNSPSGSPARGSNQRLSYQLPNVFPSNNAPDSPASDHRFDNTSVRSFPHNTSYPGSVDHTGLPPGAAAPSRIVGGEPAYHEADSRMIGSGNVSPPGAQARSPVIPSSLIPGRPGSAAPLAPIGHAQPALSPMGYSPGPYPPRQGVVPPWQQQQQQQYHPPGSQHLSQYSGGPPVQQYRAHSPMTGDFDGSGLLQDVYGGIDDSPYAGAQMGRQGYQGRG